MSYSDVPRVRRSLGLQTVVTMLGLLGHSSVTLAQDARVSEVTAEPPKAVAQIRPPALLQFVEAEPPVGVELEGTVVVELKLSIDKEGRVTASEVIGQTQAGFDEAALRASRALGFQPAMRGDVAVGSKILFRYEFKNAEPAPLPDSTAAVEPFPQPDPASDVSPKRASVAATAVTPEAPRTIEVTVRGHSERERLERSAQAINVIAIENEKYQSADLGEVLARTEGVGVRRGGGLGSDERISLNGLTDDQIRFFVDGIPLEFSGFNFGISTVPVNLIDRVEVYQGVVPIRFGADALGGAVNLVTDRHTQGSKAAASYEVGSFGTHRFTLGARHLFEPSGFFTRVNAFVDSADNGYSIDVEVPDEFGRLRPARVNRFHDTYRAKGAGVEFGFVDRPWARRLLLRAYATDYHKDIQHNVVMTVPYGDVTWGELAKGATLRFDQRLSHRFFFDSVAAYAHSEVSFRDVGDCVYDWFGQCVRERRQPGEIESDARDTKVWEHAVLLRPTLGVELAEGHQLKASISGTLVTRTGRDRETNPGARDPLTADRDLHTVVSGAEYQATLFEDRLENIAFVKHYLQFADSEEPLPGDIFRRRDRNTSSAGFGNAFRFHLTDWLTAKTSYEWATRLPRPDEVFGDGALIIANLDLAPERSHNLNLGLAANASDKTVGDLRLSTNGFLRDADQLIVLLGNDRLFSHQNVYGARSLGVEAASGWTSWREYIALDANVTWQSFRNTSSAGTFGDFEGDRIPNRPWLFANGAAVGKLKGVISARDELSLAWNVRYVKGFFRGWESVGLRRFKQTVPSQMTHNFALTYLAKTRVATTSSTLEVQNLTDAYAFDFFGVQRPGRAFFWKGTLEI